MRRRTFVTRIGYIGALAAAAALPYGLARFATPSNTDAQAQLRPPGAAWPETDFVEACIGCGLCGEVCPVACIKFNHQLGGENVNTPYIEPAKVGCILCGKCMEACPTDALNETEMNDIEMGVAKIDRGACYPWVDQGVCGVCVGICPIGEEAIDYEFANIYRPIVKQGCVGCGLCVEVCPEPSLPIRVTPRNGVSTIEATG
jgi:ferredoxin-type protein NapG